MPTCIEVRAHERKHINGDPCFEPVSHNTDPLLTEIYTAFRGALPENHIVKRICSHHACVNPDHLVAELFVPSADTPAAPTRTRTFNHKPRHDSRPGFTKTTRAFRRVTQEQVIDIYTNTLTNVDCAAKHGLSVITVSAIRVGKRFPEITKDLVRGVIQTVVKKLTPEQALAIYNAPGSFASIARHFNVSPGLVTHIKNGIVWNRITLHPDHPSKTKSK